MHAIGRDRPRSTHAMVFATQSTHKLLAGLSQASQILVQESQTRKLDRYRFNESYLMHTSTSPQYAIIASCDVAASMMEAPGGTALVQESLQEARDFRRAMRKVEQEYDGSWWFRVWGPDNLSSGKALRQEEWMLHADEKWHGFGPVEPGFNMLDPIKATIITPGLDMEGEFADTGIPAAVVTKYLAEHGVVVEKTGLYSFFVMFTIGITKGLCRYRHPGGGRHQVPGRARRGGGEDRALFVLRDVHHRHHQGSLEHAGDRAAAVQGRLRREPAAVAGDA